MAETTAETVQPPQTSQPDLATPPEPPTTEADFLEGVEKAMPGLLGIWDRQFNDTPEITDDPVFQAGVDNSGEWQDYLERVGNQPPVDSLAALADWFGKAQNWRRSGTQSCPPHARAHDPEFTIEDKGPLRPQTESWWGGDIHFGEDDKVTRLALNHFTPQPRAPQRPGIKGTGPVRDFTVEYLSLGDIPHLKVTSHLNGKIATFTPKEQEQQAPPPA